MRHPKTDHFSAAPLRCALAHAPALIMLQGNSWKNLTSSLVSDISLHVIWLRSAHTCIAKKRRDHVSTVSYPYICQEQAWKWESTTWNFWLVRRRAIAAIHPFKVVGWLVEGFCKRHISVSEEWSSVIIIIRSLSNMGLSIILNE